MTAFDSAVLALSPNSYWKLNETSGTNLVDSGADAKDLTLTGSGYTLDTSTGLVGVGHGIRFTASAWARRASALTQVNTDKFSIAGIFKAYSAINDLTSPLVCGSYSGGHVNPYYTFFLGASSPNWRVVVDNGTGFNPHDSGTLMGTGSWHVVFFIYDGTNIKVYVDNVEVFTQALTGNVGDMGTFAINNIPALNNGAYASDVGASSVGYWADYVLTSGDRAALYNAATAYVDSAIVSTVTTVSSSESQQSYTYFGNSGSGGATRILAANTDYAETFLCTATGSITIAKAFLTGGGAGSTSVRFIVYNTQQIAEADPTGYSIIGYSDTVVIGSGDAGAWINFPFSTPASVVNGTYYALGVQVDNTVIIDCSGLGGFFNGSDTFSDGPAATYPSGGSQSGSQRKLSVQAGVFTVAVLTDSATISTSTTVSSSDDYATGQYSESATISTSTIVSSNEALYVDSAILSTATTLSSTEAANYLDSSTISTLTSLNSTEIFISDTDFATVRPITTVIAVERINHPTGSWGPNDTDDGIFVWP